MTQGPSGLHLLMTLKPGLPGVMEAGDPHRLFEVAAAPPYVALCMCVECTRAVCMQMLGPAISDPLLGPVPLFSPSPQERRSWQMTNSPKTCSDSYNCSVRGTTMVRRRGGWKGEWKGAKVWGQSARVAQVRLLAPHPLWMVASPAILDLIVHPSFSAIIKPCPPTFLNPPSNFCNLATLLHLYLL